jgi:hypothetical protein
MVQLIIGIMVHTGTFIVAGDDGLGEAAVAFTVSCLCALMSYLL